MATQVLTDAKLWLHDVAVTDLANTLELSTSRESLDNTRFGADARHMRAGLFTISASASGFADMTDYDSDLFDIYDNATVGPISVAATSADGDTAYTTKALTTTLQPLGGSVGDLSALSVQADGSGGVRPIRGTILHDESAETATDVGTGRELGAVSASQSVFGALHVVDFSGTPTLDVLVQSDVDDTWASPTTQLTFAQATGKTGEFLSAAGAVTDTWWRVSFTIGGGTPSITFAVIVGIASTAL